MYYTKVLDEAIVNYKAFVGFRKGLERRSSPCASASTMLP